MKYELKNDTLTIFLEGELNSSSAEDVEKGINNLIKANSFKTLAIDMSELVYMSSAGIRIVMRLKQQYNEVILANMPDSVYEVFSMVGISDLFKITRLSE